MPKRFWLLGATSIFLTACGVEESGSQDPTVEREQEPTAETIAEDYESTYGAETVDSEPPTEQQDDYLSDEESADNGDGIANISSEGEAANKICIGNKADQSLVFHFDRENGHQRLTLSNGAAVCFPGLEFAGNMSVSLSKESARSCAIEVNGSTRYSLLSFSQCDWEESAP